jgi:diguanylate cyclase (GGDEF)-like protein
MSRIAVMEPTSLLRRLRAIPAVRSWPVWSTPPQLLAFIISVVVAATGITLVSALVTTPRLEDFAVFALLIVCGAICVAVAKSEGEGAGVTKDLLSVWTLPAALILPPVYALIVIAPLMVIRQAGRPTLLYRRVFSVAAVGLANVAASVLFRALLPEHVSLLSTSLLSRSNVLSSHPTAVILAMVGCGIVGCAVNVFLIATAVRMSSPEVRWRDVLGDREARTLDAGEICLGVVVAASLLQSVLLVVVMVPPALLIQRSLTHAQLRAAARTDPKTGLLNAGTWQQETEFEMIRAARQRLPMAILIVDLDHFKNVNDKYGHLVGDQVLFTAANALRNTLREYDLLGRFGGEEFTIALPNTGHAEALQIADRLRRLLGSTPTILDDDRSVYVNASIGVALHGVHGTELNELLSAADLALYRAKEAGRNRVEVAPGAPTPAVAQVSTDGLERDADQ